MSRNTLNGRSMFIWRLAPVVNAEMGVANMVARARHAHLSGVWIKIADGASPYENVTSSNRKLFEHVRDAMGEAGIAVWGWHVPYGGSVENAHAEAVQCVRIAKEVRLDGVVMDVEIANGHFKGGMREADAYAATLRAGLPEKMGLAMCGNDTPKNFPGYPFEAFIKSAQFNAPQVYYGRSPSVASRLDRAIEANRQTSLPFVPVGAAWVGKEGGCESASACAERAREFIRLAEQNQFRGYSFWHWMGAPAQFWEVLFEVAPAAPAAETSEVAIGRVAATLSAVGAG